MTILLRRWKAEGPKNLEKKSVFFCLLFQPTCQLQAISSNFWSTWPSTWHPRPPEIRPKRLPKSIKKGIENMMQVGLVFGPLLERIWVDFGANWVASWIQVGTKIWKIGVPRRCQKNDRKKEARGAPRHSGKVGLLAPKNPSGISKTTIPGSQEPTYTLLHSTIVPWGHGGGYDFI